MCLGSGPQFSTANIAFHMCTCLPVVQLICIPKSQDYHSTRRAKMSWCCSGQRQIKDFSFWGKTKPEEEERKIEKGICIDTFTTQPQPIRARPLKKSWWTSGMLVKSSRPGEQMVNSLCNKRPPTHPLTCHLEKASKRDPLRRVTREDSCLFDIPLGIQSWIKDGSRLVLHLAVRK